MSPCARKRRDGREPRSARSRTSSFSLSPDTAADCSDECDVELVRPEPIDSAALVRLEAIAAMQRAQTVMRDDLADLSKGAR